MTIKPVEISLFKFFVDILKPYRMYLIGMFFIALYWGVNTTLSPYVLKCIIDKVANFAGDKHAIVHAVMFDVALYIVLWCLNTSNLRLLDWIEFKIFPQLRYDITNKMFAYVGQHAHSYFQKNFTGSVASKIADMNASSVVIISTINEAITQFFGLTIAIMSMLIIHPLFAVLLFVWAAVFLLIALKYLKPVRDLSHVFAASKTGVMGKIVDCVGNISNIRLFARHSYENSLLRKVLDQTVVDDRKMRWEMLKMRMSWDLSILALMTANICMLINMYSNNQVTIGDFTFIIMLSLSIFYNLWYLAGRFVIFAEELGRSKQALSLLAEKHDIIDAPNAQPLVLTHGCIEFDDVSFHYAKANALFQHKNVTIEKGQKIGLVGLSGSGKSTFVNLILRLFDLASGCIYIDGQNIQNVTQQSLRANIAMIPQDISLFHRTLMENIRYGRIEATDAEVIAASKKAQCHEFIMQMDHDYQSLVGERGIKLSGGQRQRIAIARAILKNAPILILDEATSALDSLTENLIQEGLQSLMAGRTVIVIAHRLSTLSAMDRILVFDGGVIIEDGSHAELMRTAGHYSRMWHMQARGFLPEKF